MWNYFLLLVIVPGLASFIIYLLAQNLSGGESLPAPALPTKPQFQLSEAEVNDFNSRQQMVELLSEIPDQIAEPDEPQSEPELIVDAVFESLPETAPHQEGDPESELEYNPEADLISEERPQYLIELATRHKADVHQVLKQFTEATKKLRTDPEEQALAPDVEVDVPLDAVQGPVTGAENPQAGSAIDQEAPPESGEAPVSDPAPLDSGDDKA